MWKNKLIKPLFFFNNPCAQKLKLFQTSIDLSKTVFYDSGCNDRGSQTFSDLNILQSQTICSMYSTSVKYIQLFYDVLKY